ncbi:YceI family protein [Flavobacterium caeni]|uniref:YceI-like domain-containing protein n=1 Tax=Flavobacterium caeni TaxID=490189 RepID=A0A1G5HPG2_9FLAO|nr:YceI family protein [Flavobacterium caeni]SCY65666.1 YceI-like domain-containing protein [Flavobacterium caeni]
MKTTLTTLLLLIAISASAQKMITKTGKIEFEASVPSFEEVKATHNAATAVLNAQTGEFASLALVKGFRFKIALMEEHFNENYVESDKHPKATFKGKIENFDAAALGTTFKDFSIKGQLELHGKSKAIAAPAKIRKTDAGIEIISNFAVNASDFDIQIPSVVKSKVSNKVNIRSEFTVK